MVWLKLRHHGTSQLAVGSSYYNPHDVPTCHNSLIMVEHHTVHVNIQHTPIRTYLFRHTYRKQRKYSGTTASYCMGKINYIDNLHIDTILHGALARRFYTTVAVATGMD